MSLSESNIMVLSKKDRAIWLGGLVLCGLACALVGAINLPRWTLQVCIAITVLWIIVPVGILFYRQSLREEDNTTLDLELGEGPKDLKPATPEEISSFVSMVKNESSMSVSTAGSVQGYDDLCPICLDDHDIGDSLCTLQCGHVFHEKCMDCLVGRAYEQARTRESSECVGGKLLGTIKCPLCRQPMVQCEESATVC